MRLSIDRDSDVLRLQRLDLDCIPCLVSCLPCPAMPVAVLQMAVALEWPAVAGGAIVHRHDAHDKHGGLPVAAGGRS